MKQSDFLLLEFQRTQALMIYCDECDSTIDTRFLDEHVAYHREQERPLAEKIVNEISDHIWLAMRGAEYEIGLCRQVSNDCRNSIAIDRIRILLGEDVGRTREQLRELSATPTPY